MHMTMSETLLADTVKMQAESQRLGISTQTLRTYLEAAHSAGDRRMHAMAKPIGSACNLDCTYCYYLSKEKLLDQSGQRMGDAMLEAYIADYIASQDGAEIAFTWHGGEPTLLGLGYFERIVALQRKYTPPGRRVVNDMQTNGVLLDDAWCDFLAEHDFLVGLSIDGPAHLHDRHRVNKGGRPTLDATLAAAARLQARKIGFATLSVVNADTALHPLEVYRFLRDDVGSTFMQFIPCVEPRNFATVAPDRHRRADLAGTASRARDMVTPWSVASVDWGDFLVAVFDEWRVHDRGRIKVNLIESFLLQMQGKPGLSCTSSPVCGKNIAVEHDGRVFSCDHYVYPEHQIGQVGESSLAEMVFSVPQLEFGLNKFNTLPRACRECSYLKLCWGECPRTRLLRTSESGKNLSYLCEGWKVFYAHAIPAHRQLT
jgi:uncharacterized protein